MEHGRENNNCREDKGVEVGRRRGKRRWRGNGQGEGRGKDKDGAEGGMGKGQQVWNRGIGKGK